MKKKKVVIIGGGFAGSHAAKHLEKSFDVTLIDTKEYFEFTPGILRTIVEPTHIRKIQVMHTHYLKWARLIVGKVREIHDRHVLVGRRRIFFDYLVVASGSSYNAPFKEQNIITATRGRHLRNFYDKLCRAKSVLIIGGGLVGVELAGEICDKYEDKEITIVHAKSRLIERNHEKAMKYAEDYLKKRKVNILFNERVKEINGKICYTDKGKELCPDITFLCTGITPNYRFMKNSFSSCLNERNQIKVNKYLQLDGKKNIFAVGDVAGVHEEKTGQNAERQADVIVKNICALEKGGKFCEYKTKKSPLVISLGKHRGIFTKGNFVWNGRLPAFLKGVVERIEMWKKRRIN